MPEPPPAPDTLPGLPVGGPSGSPAEEPAQTAPSGTPLAVWAARRVAGLHGLPQPPLIRLRRPVVLMHGFGLIAGLRRHGHLHDEAMDLRARGVLAYAPNVPAYDTIAMRAAAWARRFEAILAETGADKLHLVAHSMGGLDARRLVSREGWHDRVATLTTVATPHHGASVAEIVLESPSLLRTPALGLADWAGTSLLVDHGSANVRAALAELTRESIQTAFNPATPDHPDVVYRSWAGRAGRGTPHLISPFLAAGNALIHAREGVNDGIVGTASARWTGFQGVLDADHARQIGLPGGLPRAFSSRRFFRALVQSLADEEAGAA